MTIQVNLYDTSTLLGVYQDVAPVSSYWLNLCFGSIVVSDDEYIDFEKLVENRKLAPLVIPTSQGVGIYDKASSVTRLKPAYVKPKDAVSPSRLIKKSAESGGVLLANQTPQQRGNAIVADIIRTHANAIDRREEWLAAGAILDGKVTLKGDNYPEAIVDFGRAANHTVVLGSGARWGDSGVSIIDNIQTWVDRVKKAPFGGIVNRITVGVDVWAVMRKDAELLKLLDTTIRGSNDVLNRSLRTGEEAELVGRLGNLEVWVYSGYYQDASGAAVNYMSPKDIVLTGPNVMGVRAYGAILDHDANLQALRVFPKMWKQPDPSVMYIMHQSAPLMVPVNTNNTLKATVLA